MLHGDTVDRHRVAALHHTFSSLAADGWHTKVSRPPDWSHPDQLAAVRADSWLAIEPDALPELRATDASASSTGTSPQRPHTPRLRDDQSITRKII